jgi:peptide-methionine (S)-S-oxide reductase
LILFILNITFEKKNMPETKLETIVLGGGCFWCIEAVMKRLKGVHTVVSGYSGGIIKNPSYREICTGKTGHAEVVKVEFDQSQINLEDILQVFFAIHDPTTLNRQGNDIGTQYRSVIFYNDQNQRKVCEIFIKKLVSMRIYKEEIVTEIKQLETFYPAEEEHWNYYDLNREQAYCRLIIDPKISKLYKSFNDLKK